MARSPYKSLLKEMNRIEDLSTNNILQILAHCLHQRGIPHRCFRIGPDSPTMRFSMDPFELVVVCEAEVPSPSYPSHYVMNIHFLNKFIQRTSEGNPMVPLGDRKSDSVITIYPDDLDHVRNEDFYSYFLGSFHEYPWEHLQKAHPRLIMDILRVHPTTFEHFSKEGKESILLKYPFLRRLSAEAEEIYLRIRHRFPSKRLGIVL